MMVSVQSQVAHLTEQINMQHKEIYDQRKEIEELKEENRKLQQQVNGQHTTPDDTEVSQQEELFKAPQTWAQLISKNVHPRQGHVQPNTYAKKMQTERVTQPYIDDQEQMERTQKQHNVVISGVEEDETKETARSLREKIQDIFNTHFDMTDVPIEGAHRIGKKRDDKPKIIVCTIMDARKRQIILNNASTYLKGHVRK